GLATVQELRNATGDAPSVAARALAHFPWPVPPELVEVARRLAESSNASLQDAALVVLAFANPDEARPLLRAATDRGGGSAIALSLAIAGDETDARWLVERGAQPTLPIVEALGWSGSAAAIGLLVDIVASHPEANLRAAAASSLERITGANL